MVDDGQGIRGEGYISWTDVPIPVDQSLYCTEKEVVLPDAAVHSSPKTFIESNRRGAPTDEGFYQLPVEDRAAFQEAMIGVADDLTQSRADVPIHEMSAERETLNRPVILGQPNRRHSGASTNSLIEIIEDTDPQGSSNDLTVESPPPYTACPNTESDLFHELSAEADVQIPVSPLSNPSRTSSVRGSLPSYSLQPSAESNSPHELSSETEVQAPVSPVSGLSPVGLVRDSVLSGVDGKSFHELSAEAEVRVQSGDLSHANPVPNSIERSSVYELPVKVMEYVPPPSLYELPADTAVYASGLLVRDLKRAKNHFNRTQGYVGLGDPR